MSHLLNDQIYLSIYSLHHTGKWTKETTPDFTPETTTGETGVNVLALLLRACQHHLHPPVNPRPSTLMSAVCKMNLHVFSVTTSASLQKLVTGRKKKRSFAIGFINSTMTLTEWRGLWR